MDVYYCYFIIIIIITIIISLIIIIISIIIITIIIIYKYICTTCQHMSTYVNINLAVLTPPGPQGLPAGDRHRFPPKSLDEDALHPVFLLGHWLFRELAVTVSEWTLLWNKSCTDTSPSPFRERLSGDPFQDWTYLTGLFGAHPISNPQKNGKNVEVATTCVYIYI